MDKEDKDAIVAARKDRNEFAFLYEKYVDKIFNYFWYRVGHDRDVAEDLTQETFVRAYKHLDRFQIRKTSYAFYLLTIAHNLLVNYYREPKAISLESVGDVPKEVWGDLVRKDEARALWRAIQQLPSQEQNILYLKYQKGLKVKEIAQIVGKSENAVKLSLSRTRKKLKNHPHLKDIAQFADTKRKATKARYKNL